MTNKTIYLFKRKKWRNWLQKHFNKKDEIWLVFPRKSTGKPRILYNDAVEEALCFGWIDSTVKALDHAHTIQRFTPRKPKSNYSQANKERLKGLRNQGMIHPDLVQEVDRVLGEEFIFPADILRALEKDPVVWNNYQSFSDSYKRIRIAYIDSARKRHEEFKKRLVNFIDKTRENKLIPGYGGINKYY